MPEERVELSRGCPRGILSPLLLPFRHSGVIAGPQLSAGADPVEGAFHRASAKRSPRAGYAACGLWLVGCRACPDATDLFRPVTLHAGGHLGLLGPRSSLGD